MTHAFPGDSPRGIALMKAHGVKACRFSVSRARVIPGGNGVSAAKRRSEQ